ncbi:unnamed protein product [Victoria cruziana]
MLITGWALHCGSTLQALHRSCRLSIEVASSYMGSVEAVVKSSPGISPSTLSSLGSVEAVVETWYFSVDWYSSVEAASPSSSVEAGGNISVIVRANGCSTLCFFF